LLLLQLQQVPAAGESPKVPVKDQQEPMARIVGELVRAFLGILQFERNRVLARQTHALRHAFPSPCVSPSARRLIG